MTRATTGSAARGGRHERPADDGLHCLIDADGTIVDGSDGLLHALGYGAEDRGPLNYRRIVDPLHLATMLREQRAAEAEGTSVGPSRVLLVTRGGGRIWAEVALRSAVHDGAHVTEALFHLERGGSPGRSPDLSRILDAMTRAQVLFIEAEDPKIVFGGLLAEFLDLTDSAFGFIGEVLHDAAGAPFIRAHAQTNIAWNDATRELYERTLADGMEFHNLGTLFGACLTTGTPVIANQPAADPRSGGLPSGHPPLDSFLGLPVLHGDQMVGMVGIANRPGGYDEPIVAYLGPLLATTAGITDAYRQRGARRSIAAALQEREGLLRAVIEHAPGAIYVKDAAGRYVVYNPAGARSRGLDPDAVIGRTDLDLFDADEAATFRLEDLWVMQSRETRAYESTITVDGQRRTVLNTKSPWLDEGGSLRGIIGITTDITERVAVAEALEHERELLARSETMLRGIILSAGEAIITSDLQGRILSFNPAAESMFGFESDAIVGQQVEVLMPGDLRPGHEQGMRRRAEGIRGPGAGRWTRRTAQRSDGTTFPVEIFIAEVSRAEDKRILALIRDMTEHVAMQEMKDDFVSVVSHELRTPLTSIQGALGLILGGAGGEIDPQTRELIEVAHANARRLVRLTNDLLDLQKVEAGRMTYRMVVAEIAEIAERTVASMEPLAKGKGVRLDLERPHAGLFATVDPDRIAQVLTNLLGNGIAVSDPGAVVHVRVVEEPDAALIEIEDHGPGIAPADRERVWEKFVRVESGAAARTQGTGIGLPLARALVEAHGGTIDFVSTVGKGTTFRVRLPRRVGLGLRLVRPRPAPGPREKLPPGRRGTPRRPRARRRRAPLPRPSRRRAAPPGRAPATRRPRARTSRRCRRAGGGRRRARPPRRGRLPQRGRAQPGGRRSAPASRRRSPRRSRRSRRRVRHRERRRPRGESSRRAGRDAARRAGAHSPRTRAGPARHREGSWPCGSSAPTTSRTSFSSSGSRCVTRSGPRSHRSDPAPASSPGWRSIRSRTSSSSTR